MTNKQKEDFINEIIETKGEKLPVVFQDAIKIFEFTDFEAKAWKMLIDKLSKLSDQKEAHETALASGQQWGIAD